MASLTPSRPISISAPSPIPAWSLDRTTPQVVFVRCTGGAEPKPQDWRSRLAAALLAIPSAAAVGARRLRPDGSIASVGEFLVHPKGLHHLGRGLNSQCYRFPEEVDAIGGGVLAVDAAGFAAVDGEAVLERRGRRLGPIELCLELRRRGGRIIAMPDVTVLESEAEQDTETGQALSRSEREGFRDRFGFDPLAPDLEEVRRRHPRSGLLWNVRLHGPPLPFEKYDRRGSMHWQAYQQVEVYRKRADHLTGLVQRLSEGARVLDLGCGDGLFSHLLARQGLEVVGLDPEIAAIEHATETVDRETYAGPKPVFQRGEGSAIPAPDASFGTVAMFDVIEHLPNPVPVLQECRRVLAPGGRLVLSTPAWQYQAWSDPVYHVCEFTMEELVALLTAATDLRITDTGRIGGVYRDLVVVARRDDR